MVLEYIRDNLDGKHWEEWCDACYRDRYQHDHFVKVQSNYLGDAGIEGFTKSGIVYQCYCPEKVVTDDDLYNQLRDKMTRDITKFLNNGDRLKKLGVRIVREWHFVIPEYRDKRILEHKETKTQEVKLAKVAEPDKYFYIHEEFEIVIKVAEDLRVELIRLIRQPLVDIKMNLAVKSIKDIDWTQCNTISKH